MVWGILRICVTTLGAIVVLGIVAWPVALVMAALVASSARCFGTGVWAGWSRRRKSSPTRIRGRPA